MTVDEKDTGFDASYDPKDIAKIEPQSDSASASSLEDRRGVVKVIDSTFDTTEDPRFYRPNEDYEGYHRWDPEFEWTEEEEKAIIKKVGTPAIPITSARRSINP